MRITYVKVSIIGGLTLDLPPKALSWQQYDKRQHFFLSAAILTFDNWHSSSSASTIVNS